MSFTAEPLLIFDGACGTTLQTIDIPLSAWDGLAGCNEILNLTAPEIVIDLHSRFLSSGAMVIETNTFGSSSIVLSEYGLEDKVVELNTVAVQNAQKAIQEVGGRKRYIAGSVGPTTKLPALGHISPQELAKAVKEQVIALVEAGVDALIVETSQDMLQSKTTLIACFEVIENLKKDIPVLCSVTFEKQGTMLLGTDIAAVCATVFPFPIFSLGLNCATGPTDMVSHIQYLSKNWDRRISCIPNQGMPEVRNGQTYYPLSPADYAEHMHTFITEYGVSIVGGCCGTSPEHIHTLAQRVQNVQPHRNENSTL